MSRKRGSRAPRRRSKWPSRSAGRSRRAAARPKPKSPPRVWPSATPRSAAPFAGLVTERKADPGSLATPGAPLLTLEREGNLRLEASIDESRLGLARIGESVAVEIDGLNRTVSGRVGEIVPSVDPATRTFTAKIDLPGLPGLRAGMFGRAAFAAGTREALLVPQSAVLERGQIRSVHVVEGDTARLRLVTLGEARGNLYEILSGLTAGERIIVAPPPMLADGGRVASQQAASGFRRPPSE